MTAPFRVVIAADSLGLPRRGPDPVRAREAWPTLLEERLRGALDDVAVVNRAQRGLTLPALVGKYDDLVGLWEADVLVLQVGIVDCAPRVFGQRQRALLSSRLVPGTLRRIVTRLAARYRRQIITMRPRVRYTSPRQFRSSLRDLGSRLEERDPRILVLPILGSIERHEARSPGYSESVTLYNAAWREWCRAGRRRFLEYGDVFAEAPLEQVVATDGHHLTVAGNRLIADAVAARILSEQGG